MHKCKSDDCDRWTVENGEQCTMCQEQEVPEDISHHLPADYEEDEQATLTDGGSE